ncbi:MAG TPA: PDZ domain-containing protein [Terriglobales bacterium]|nr:PDZ domain-containing protein [Terriglobales bacterium]
MSHVCAVVLLCCSALAFAQDTPRAEIFFGYSYLNASTNGLTARQNVNGAQFSLVGNISRWAGAEANVSGYYKSFLYTLPNCVPNNIAGIPCTNKVIARDYAVVFGPRVHYKWAFVHALGGLDYLNEGILGTSTTNHSIAGAFGGGALFKVSRYIALEGSADYFIVSGHNINPYVGSATQNDFRAAVGIAFTLGHADGPVANSATPPTQGTTMARPAHGAGMSIPSLGVVVVSDNGGAQITGIAPNGVAALAGLHPGDIINAANGVPVKTPADLANALSGMAPGTQVRLEYTIGGQWQSETTLALGR